MTNQEDLKKMNELKIRRLIQLRRLHNSLEGGAVTPDEERLIQTPHTIAELQAELANRGLSRE